MSLELSPNSKERDLGSTPSHRAPCSDPERTLTCHTRSPSLLAQAAPHQDTLCPHWASESAQVLRAPRSVPKGRPLGDSHSPKCPLPDTGTHADPRPCSTEKPRLLAFTSADSPRTGCARPTCRSLRRERGRGGARPGRGRARLQRRVGAGPRMRPDGLPELGRAELRRLRRRGRRGAVLSAWGGVLLRVEPGKRRV